MRLEWSPISDYLTLIGLILISMQRCAKGVSVLLMIRTKNLIRSRGGICERSQNGSNPWSSDSILRHAKNGSPDGGGVEIMGAWLAANIAREPSCLFRISCDVMSR